MDRTSNKRWGAYPEDWDNLELIEGLGEDLLPVVSNPKAKISSNSYMKQLGKTPSVYNGDNEVIGVSKWTSKKTTSGQISHWRENPDYGICLQTRNIRAFDIDVDGENAKEIVIFIMDQLAKIAGDYDIAVRSRSDSEKCLIPVKIQGDLRKRTVYVEGGMIEFLATGQQFVAFGTHPKGKRYQWNNGSFVEISLEQFEEIWKQVCDKFGISKPTEGNLRKRGEDLNIDDPIIDQLDILGYSSDGKGIHIRCPFEEFHTTESVIGSTTYFPAGTGGYEQGHFKCLHAHCEHRTDDDFIQALNLQLTKFEPLELEEGEDYQEPLPPYERDKQGRVLATTDNIINCLMRPELCGYHISRDTFKDQIMLRPCAERYSTIDVIDKWRELQDTDYTKLKQILEKQNGFKPIATTTMRETVHLVARENNFDSAVEWLNALQWDGVKRIDSFIERVFGTDNHPYHKAVGQYMWSAMAGRVLEPGVKADMTPIIVGKQGLMKSTCIEALVPAPHLFVEVDLAEKEDDRVRRTKGRLVGEIGEMRGLYSTAMDNIKAYIVRRYDTWVPKFMEQSHTYFRRIFFIGTSNHVEMFSDKTGNRRWLPIDAVTADRHYIEENRTQLWAEAAQLFKKYGVMYHDAERLGNARSDRYMITDPWTELITNWLASSDDMDGTTPMTKGYVATSEILQCALGMTKSQGNTGHGKHIGEIMRNLGYEKVRKRVEGKNLWVWVGSDKIQEHFSSKNKVAKISEKDLEGLI